MELQGMNSSWELSAKRTQLRLKINKLVDKRNGR